MIFVKKSQKNLQKISILYIEGCILHPTPKKLFYIVNMPFKTNFLIIFKGKEIK